MFSSVSKKLAFAVALSIALSFPSGVRAQDEQGLTTEAPAQDASTTLSTPGDKDVAQGSDEKGLTTESAPQPTESAGPSSDSAGGQSTPTGEASEPSESKPGDSGSVEGSTGSAQPAQHVQLTEAQSDTALEKTQGTGKVDESAAPVEGEAKVDGVSVGSWGELAGNAAGAAGAAPTVAAAPAAQPSASPEPGLGKILDDSIGHYGNVGAGAGLVIGTGIGATGGTILVPGGGTVTGAWGGAFVGTGVGYTVGVGFGIVMGLGVWGRRKMFGSN
jgi:hypothetical protein